MRTHTHSALTALVSEAVDLVVHSRRGPDGPRVMEVTAVEDLNGSGDGAAFTTTALFTRRAYDQPLAWSGNVPVRVGEALAASGEDTVALLQTGTARRETGR